MKSHKYWSIGAMITMLGTFYTGYKGLKEGHKYFAASSLLCICLLYTSIEQDLYLLYFARKLL